MLKKIGRIALYSTLVLSLAGNVYLYELASSWFNFARREYVVIQVLKNSCGLSQAQQ